LSVLASEFVDSLLGPTSPCCGTDIVVDRIPVSPGFTMNEVLADLVDQTGVPDFRGRSFGVRLLYVEAGGLVVLDEAGETTYRQGEHVLFPPAATFDVRNDTSDCTSFVLISMAPGGAGGGFASDVSGPNLSSFRDCPVPQRLLWWRSQPRFEGPARLFLGRMIWDPTTATGFPPGFDQISHLGPIFLLVETGTLTIPMSGESTAYLKAGSSLLVPAGESYTVFYSSFGREPEPAIALVVGVEPAA
jgi:hypothetical protein